MRAAEPDLQAVGGAQCRLAGADAGRSRALSGNAVLLCQLCVAFRELGVAPHRWLLRNARRTYRRHARGARPSRTGRAEERRCRGTAAQQRHDLPADEPTQLAQYLQEGRFVATVEMRPPKGIATQRMLAGAHMLKEAGANFLDVADSPLARMRMSAWAAAQLIQRAVGLETILHFPTRGRNLLRIQGDLLAAYAMDVRNLFVVMGDPTHIGDYPEAMDNYDIVPTGLIQLIKQRLNTGVEQSGESIDRPTNFVVGAALNLEPADPERQIALLRKKVRNGADFVLTQPVFNPAEARTSSNGAAPS
jgi:hypothetical protein